MAVLNWWSHLSGSSRLCACNEKKRKQITVSYSRALLGKLVSDHSYRRASAGELISHYIAVGTFPGIRNVILFARMVTGSCTKGAQEASGTKIRPSRDNHSAVDVGDLRQGTRSLKVQKPQLSEAFPEATIMLMTWAHSEPLSTQSTLNSRGGDRRWLMGTGMPCARQSTRELKGKNGKNCIVIKEK